MPDWYHNQCRGTIAEANEQTMRYGTATEKYTWHQTLVLLYKDGRKVESTGLAQGRFSIAEKQRNLHDTVTRLCRSVDIAAAYLQATIASPVNPTPFMLTSAKIKRGWEKEIGIPELTPGMPSRFKGRADASSENARKRKESRERERATRENANKEREHTDSREQYSSNQQSQDNGSQNTSASSRRDLNLRTAGDFLFALTGDEDTRENRDRLLGNIEYQRSVYRRAAKIAHPDSGGTHERFVRLQQVWHYLKRQGIVK